MKDKKLVLLCPLWLILDGEFYNFEIGEYYYFDVFSYEKPQFKEFEDDGAKISYEYDCLIDPYWGGEGSLCGRIVEIKVLQKDKIQKKYKSLNECTSDKTFAGDLLITLEECEYKKHPGKDLSSEFRWAIRFVLGDAFCPYGLELTKEFKKNNCSMIICHPNQNKLQEIRKELAKIKSFSDLFLKPYDLAKKEDVHNMFNNAERKVFITTNKDREYKKIKENFLERNSETRSTYYDISMNRLYTKITYFKTDFICDKYYNYYHQTITKTYFRLGKDPKKIVNYLIKLVFLNDLDKK